jgi:SAM-dependent methyltransferase
MAADVHSTAEFYATPRGVIATRLLRERMQTMWPTMTGRAVLGLGYTTPYLRLWRDSAARCVAATPGPTGTAPLPADGLGLSCLVEEDALPFPDLCFDNILLVHGLENAENARRLLREVWRVLKDDGQLLVVAPNRRGMWAHVESTPFGHGQPYSTGQIGDLLAASLFRVERRDTALYVPPTRWRVVLRGAALWERTGRYVAPHLAGVTLTEAVKDLYAAMPVGAQARRRTVLADAA